MNPLLSIPNPDLRSVLHAHRNELFASLNCHQIGTIVAFDAEKQTASVRLNVKRLVYNQTQEIDAGLQLTPTIVTYPLLVDCPVFVLTGGVGMLTMPIATGDTCLVCFNDRDIDKWFATGGTEPPNSARMHDLSDGLCLVGFRSSANPVSNYETDATTLRHDTTRVRLKAGGGTVVVDANISQTSENGGTSVVNADVTHTSANGGVVAAKTKVDIHNSAGSLKAALDQLCAALDAWVDTGGHSPNVATKTAITAAKTAIGAVIE